MKAELTTRLSEMTDTQYAFMLLRKEKLKHSETIQVYAERLLTLAEDAFVGQQGAPIQRQLIFFVNGTTEDQLNSKCYGRILQLWRLL